MRPAVLLFARPLFVVAAMAVLFGFANGNDAAAASTSEAQCAIGGGSDASPSVALGCTVSGEPSVALAGTASADPTDTGPAVVSVTTGGEVGVAAAGVIDERESSATIAGGIGGSDGYAAASGVMLIAK
jgi:hypothetical protein